MTNVCTGHAGRSRQKGRLLQHCRISRSSELGMFTVSTRSSLDIFRLLIATLLTGIAIAIVVLTWRWPLVWDAQVFHYIHFLIDHGFAPYRDIPDINMPGVYVLEGWAMQLFGGS